MNQKEIIRQFISSILIEVQEIGTQRPLVDKPNFMLSYEYNTIMYPTKEQYTVLITESSLESITKDTNVPFSGILYDIADFISQENSTRFKDLITVVQIQRKVVKTNMFGISDKIIPIEKLVFNISGPYWEMIISRNKKKR